MSSSAAAATEPDVVGGVERYRNLPDDVAPASVQRAIVIHDCWGRLSSRAGGDVVSTAPVSLSKGHPSYLKEELEIALQESLRWTQVYRAMRKLAEVDRRYQYVERPRRAPERGRTDGTVRELHRAEEGSA